MTTSENQVIDDRDRQQERAHPIRKPRPGEGQHPQGERGVRGHRGAPAVGRGTAGVQGQVNRDRHQQAAQPGHDRERKPLPFPQLTHVELAAGLQAEDEEEKGHQAAVHPAAKIHGHFRAAEPDQQSRVPHGLVGGRAGIRPDEGGQRHRHQDRGAAGLGAQEPAQRRLQAELPHCPRRERASRSGPHLVRQGVPPRARKWAARAAPQGCAPGRPASPRSAPAWGALAVAERASGLVREGDGDQAGLQ